MISIGLDGRRGGWVAVRIDGTQRTIHFPGHVDEIAALRFDRAAIDIPIGMMDDGVRDCDRLARQMLKPHSSRVFTGARRWLWDQFDDPDKANREAIKRTQSGVSRQLWHLGPKIMQVDRFVRANSMHNIREAHPELVFLRLNNNRPLAAKKSEEGRVLREILLMRDGFDEIEDWISGALGSVRYGTGAKIDDVLDACACAIAARDVHLKNCVPKGEAPADDHGLPMQIWY